MEVFITKDNKTYIVGSSDVTNLIYKSKDFPDLLFTQWSTGAECRGKVLNVVLSDFFETLQCFIRSYVEVIGSIPEFMESGTINLKLDKESIYDFCLNGLGIEKDHTVWERKGHFMLSGNILSPNLHHADKSNPFYDKKVVFTGVMDSINREDAAIKVRNMGGDINSSISSLTNYVIVGEGAGPSKMKKIEQYNAKGAHIITLNESEFLEIIRK